MGDIDRVNPLQRAVFGPRATEAVRQGGGRAKRHERGFDEDPEEPQTDAPEEEAAEAVGDEEPHGGLDLTI